jgi:hypothetical protein
MGAEEPWKMDDSRAMEIREFDFARLGGGRSGVQIFIMTEGEPVPNRSVKGSASWSGLLLLFAACPRQRDLG